MSIYTICKFCGELSATVDGATCFICGHKREAINMDLEPFHKKTMTEIDQIRFSIQPKETYNQMAWIHREHMDMTRLMSGSNCPKGFDRRYKEGIILPECPYCHGYYTQKIGTGSRMLSAGLFGLGSKKIGKQWHCCLCNSDF